MRYLSGLVALTLFIALGGCASAVLVGGGEEGEAKAHYPNHSDAAITDEINRRLVNDPAVSAMDITVETRGGIATLSGLVSSQSASDEAERVARGVPGVKAVHNRLRVGR